MSMKFLAYCPLQIRFDGNDVRNTDFFAAPEALATRMETDLRGSFPFSPDVFTSRRDIRHAERCRRLHHADGTDGYGFSVVSRCHKGFKAPATASDPSGPCAKRSAWYSGFGTQRNHYDI